MADLGGHVPIIKVADNLLVSLQGDLDDGAVLRLESQITSEVARTRARGALIDVSGLAIVDSFIARWTTTQKVAVLLPEAGTTNQVVQTILEMVRGGIR